MKYLVTYESYGDYKKDRYTTTEEITCDNLFEWWKSVNNSVTRGGVIILWSLKLDD